MNPYDIVLTSEITVRLIQKVGGDNSVVAAARVSTTGEEALKWIDAPPEENYGLINYLVRNRHGSPLEHSQLTFFCHMPAFVWWEWVRHRIGQTIDCDEMSFNLESGRYRELKPVFWIPRSTRKMIPAPDHKPSKPSFVEATEKQYSAIITRMEEAYTCCWEKYQILLEEGFAAEVSRSVLGFGIYYSGWVTCNPRSLMSFLSLRTHEPTAKFPSRPQAEIEEGARICEKMFSEGWPLVYRSFCENGRVGP